MQTMDIANKLVELCKQGKNQDALDTLFAEDVVSVEAGGPPNMERETKGLAAVKAKNKWWMENHEILSAHMTGPWPHDERFVVGFQYEVIQKPAGRKMTMDEVGLYTVKNGKIIREEFFYTMG